jgi:hypothetical protein
LLALCCAIESWFHEVGEKHFKDIKESKQEARFQELGLRSMRFVESMLQDPRFSGILDIIKKFKKGTIGSGHVEIPEYKKQKPQDKNSIAVNGGNRNGNDGGHGSDRTAAKSEHKKQTPLSVMGPNGRKRTVVQGNSLGMQFAYEQFPNPNKVYEFDDKCGILTFNIRNILWSQCEDSDNKLMKFQEFVAIQVLTLLTIPEEWRAGAEKGYDSLIRVYVYSLLHADKLAGRLPGRSASKK